MGLLWKCVHVWHCLWCVLILFLNTGSQCCFRFFVCLLFLFFLPLWPAFFHSFVVWFCSYFLLCHNWRDAVFINTKRVNHCGMCQLYFPFKFQGFLSSPKDEIKQYAAELFAIVIVATAQSEDIVNTVTELMGSLKDKVRLVPVSWQFSADFRCLSGWF